MRFRELVTSSTFVLNKNIFYTTSTIPTILKIKKYKSLVKVFFSFCVEGSFKA